jgi:hypothetical protein
MNKVLKKAFSLFTTLLFFANTLSAQQNHFVYVQTENKQPFYIKLDKKILSSSASGYLIIPKLQDGNYTFTVGFPRNEWPEHNVTCTVNKKDAGYLLKNFGDKGWGFFNLQTMEVIMPGPIAADNKTTGDVDKQDIFSNTLSGVVNDPSIVKRIEEKPEIKETAKPAEPEIKKEDSAKATAVITEKQEAIKTIEEKPAVKKEESAIEKPEANKIAEEKPAVKKEEPVIEKPEANKIAEDKPSVKKEDPVKNVVVKDVVVRDKEIVNAPSQIKKLFSVKSSEGTDMVYADISNGEADTIRLFIPSEKKDEAVQPEKKIEASIEVTKKEEPQKTATKNEDIKKEEEKKDTVLQAENKTIVVIPQKEESQKTPVRKEETKKEAVKKDDTKDNAPKFIDIELPNPNAGKKDTVTKQTAAVPVEKEPGLNVGEKPKENNSRQVIANSDCKNFASDDDFLKLRKKMAAAGNDEEMLTMAKKAFKSKCFTTEQVKNLAVLFLKDEGKYKFFDLAYPFVSDSYNFGTLEGQLTDNYFISRFKAMIHH